MKALCIVGSPRENGSTSYIVDSIIKGMKESKIETKKYNLGEMNINYCKGCMTCLKTRECIQRDDVDVIMSDFKEADIIVVASPSYWGDITGQLKVFFDRNTPYGNTCDGGTTIPKGKIGIGVALRAGGSRKENEKLIETVEHYFGHLEIELVEKLMIEEVMNIEDLSLKQEEVHEAYLIGSRVSKYFDV